MSENQHRLQQIEISSPLTAATSFDRAIAEARPLHKLGRRILQSDERPDHGEIHYTTTTDAISEWRSDPYGSRKFNFIADAYGISREKLSEALQEMGLGEYVRAKSEGRLVGQVSTQILKPTYYFMTNALILGYLTRHFGIPTALMVSTYETDIFSYNNNDKTAALGIIDFPVGIEPDSGSIQSVKIKVIPVGIKQSDGSVRPADNNNLSGQRCCDIIVRVAAASDEQNKFYPSSGSNGAQVTAEEALFYVQAALGITIHQEEISLTEFYKQMWVAVINRLRESGDLPSEREMPMFFVNGEQVYSSLPRLATPPELTRKILGGLNPEVDHNLTQLANGVVVRDDTGVMDPAWYYPLEYGLPDVYFECSSCGGEHFVDKLARADRLLEAHGLHTSEVRLPDIEVGELERYTVHPSGRHIDMRPVREEVARVTAPIVAEIERLKGDIAERGVDRREGRNELALLIEGLNNVRHEEYERFIRAVIENVPTIQWQAYRLFVPEVAAATYKELIGRI